MADLTKFQRSKERINEILKYLMPSDDHQANQFKLTLQQSIQIIDSKMEELKNQQIAES